MREAAFRLGEPRSVAAGWDESVLCSDQEVSEFP